MKKILSLILAAAVILSLTAGMAAKSLQSTPSRTIGVDGSISADEWGEPVFSGDKETCWAKHADYGWDFWQNTAAVAGQRFSIYFTKDENYAYIGVELTGAAGPDNGCAAVGDLWAHAHMAFTLSAYDASTTVPRITYQGETYEQYGYWMVGLLNGTAKAMESKSQGMDTYSLQDSEYAVSYSAAAGKYAYEVAVPWSATNIDPETHSAVVLSVDLADAYTTTSGNRYLISPAAQQAGNYLGPNNFRHAASDPLVISLVDTKVGNTAAPVPSEITLDGTVTDAEWGEPMIVTSPEHCQQTWGNYWEFDPAAAAAGQSAKLYVTNDANNIYLAFVLDKCALDTSCTDPGQLWKAAHFGFSVSQYSESTTVQRVEYNGQNYEQYTSFMIGLVNGTKTAVCSTQGMDAWDLPADHYAVAFDAQAGTYTYEVKLPFERTNIQFNTNKDIAVSVSAGQHYTGGAGANRYNLTTGFAFSGGPDNFQHLHNAFKVTLGSTPKVVNPYVRSVAPPRENVIILDGYISDTEWGEPVVVTAPEHCQQTWGNYWEFDPAAVSPTQTVKLYLTSDHEYLYVGAVIDECNYDGTCTDKTMLYKAAHFNFSVSDYNESTTVERIFYQGQTYEQYTGFMLGLVNGQKDSYAFTQGIDMWELPGANYEIRYDSSAKTYTYEVKLPMVQTNILSDQIALSASVGSHYTGAESANRFNLTTGAAICGGPGNWAHLNNALVFELSPNPPTGDAPLAAAVIAALCSAAGAAALMAARRRRT